MPRRVAILGSTGFIGRMALEVIAAHPDQFTVVGLAAGHNIDLFRQQVKAFRPLIASVAQENDARQLRRDVTFPIEIGHGDDSLIATAACPDADIVLTAIVGARGLLPTLAAIEQGADIALANKETLVAGGDVVMARARERGVSIVPVDSEHSAIFQCLLGRRSNDVERLILTASGGSFRHLDRSQLADVTVADALAHPTWQMGRKITIDSATLMNKGFEVIEARHLFNQTYDRINVVIHPESIVHSMVEFVDGSVMAQLASADMRIPIQMALSHPNTLHRPWRRLSFEERITLHFDRVDDARYPCLGLAYSAGRQGGTAPAVLNAANEIAVEYFLEGAISFLDIERLVASALEAHPSRSAPDVDEIIAADAWARGRVHTMVRG